MAAATRALWFLVVSVVGACALISREGAGMARVTKTLAKVTKKSAQPQMDDSSEDEDDNETAEDDNETAEEDDEGEGDASAVDDENASKNFSFTGNFTVNTADFLEEDLVTEKLDEALYEAMASENESDPKVKFMFCIRAESSLSKDTDREMPQRRVDTLRRIVETVANATSIVYEVKSRKAYEKLRAGTINYTKYGEDEEAPECFDDEEAEDASEVDEDASAADDSAVDDEDASKNFPFTGNFTVNEDEFLQEDEVTMLLDEALASEIKSDPDAKFTFCISAQSSLPEDTDREMPQRRVDTLQRIVEEVANKTGIVYEVKTRKEYEKLRAGTISYNKKYGEDPPDCFVDEEGEDDGEKAEDASEVDEVDEGNFSFTGNFTVNNGSFLQEDEVTDLLDEALASDMESDPEVKVMFCISAETSLVQDTSGVPQRRVDTLRRIVETVANKTGIEYEVKSRKVYEKLRAGTISYKKYKGDPPECFDDEEAEDAKGDEGKDEGSSADAEPAGDPEDFDYEPIKYTEEPLKYSWRGKANIYGQPLAVCGKLDVDCEIGGLNRAICLEKMPMDYCETVGLAGPEHGCEKVQGSAWCVAPGSYSLYVSKTAKDPVVECSAIPDGLFKIPMEDWRMFNFIMHADQELAGLKALFKQCSTKKAKTKFKKNFCEFAPAALDSHDKALKAEEPYSTCFKQIKKQKMRAVARTMARGLRRRLKRGVMRAVERFASA